MRNILTTPNCCRRAQFALQLIGSDGTVHAALQRLQKAAVSADEQMFQLPQPLLNPEVIQNCGFSVIIMVLSVLAILLGAGWCKQNWLREALSCYFSYDKYPPAWPWQHENQVVTFILDGVWYTVHATFLGLLL